MPAIDPIHAIILGIIQGLTEFIPVSSSGHLVILPALFGWQPQGVAFDAVLHLGTLLAVLAYFRDDWIRIARAWLNSALTRRARTADERLAWYIIIASVPAGVGGMLFEKQFEAVFGQPVVVGYFLILTAGLLIVAEALGRRERPIAELTLFDVIIIGLLQAAAILPGVSRSGSTIAGGLLTGLDRPAAARFSFLLAAPIIFGAGISQLPRALREPDLGLVSLALGFVVAAGVGYVCIAFLLRYLRRGTLYPFAAYCLLIGIVAATALGG